jgi:hypothetical protein
MQLTGCISIAWILVFAPLWIPLVFVFVFVFSVAAILLIVTLALLDGK